ncbi:hypothetical protein DMN91_007126 [Ooceraea biroi]|uniref:Uncharacterized protein n=1 Tax=Ooceraea biroi TaxID=2015173 RepID=A0A3L8DJK4_OOCBI|nr:hypothetical protein DMN91_007126 [Ooceraea biroi]
MSDRESLDDQPQKYGNPGGMDAGGADFDSATRKIRVFVRSVTNRCNASDLSSAATPGAKNVKKRGRKKYEVVVLACNRCLCGSVVKNPDTSE